MRRHVIYVICTKDHLKKIAVLLDILYMEVGGGRPLSVEKSKLKNCLKSFEMLQILDLKIIFNYLIQIMISFFVFSSQSDFFHDI